MGDGEKEEWRERVDGGRGVSEWKERVGERRESEWREGGREGGSGRGEGGGRVCVRGERSMAMQALKPQPQHCRSTGASSFTWKLDLAPSPTGIDAANLVAATHQNQRCQAVPRIVIH